jgi:ankyrin repeat protein
MAAESGHLEVVQYLVSQGADIHVNGDAALRLATLHGRLNVVQYLVSQGANVHVNKNAVLRLETKQNTETIKYLKSLP